MKKLSCFLCTLFLLFAALAMRAVPAAYASGDQLQESAVAVGDSVFFGRYEQDNNRDNGKEPIEWIVLDIQGSSALLLSRFGLDGKEYNGYSGVNVNELTWENSTLRSWLNNSFLFSAFDQDAYQAILETEINNGPEQGYQAWNTISGNNTLDRAFLLSYHEAFEQYFTTDAARRCVITDYARARGAWSTDPADGIDGLPTGYWWLRSPGQLQNSPSCVNSLGAYDHLAWRYDNITVRPAIWVDLTAAKLEVNKNGGQVTQPSFLQALVQGAGVSVGDSVFLGKYEQDNVLINGQEPIEWIVLDVQEDKALLISRYILEGKPFNTLKEESGWEHSSLRAWLNQIFFSNAFSDDEKQAILLTRVDNSAAQGNADWEPPEQNDTLDRVFLLSCQEAVSRYFVSEEQRRAAATPYARANGVYAEAVKGAEDGNAGWWWLRSSGSRLINAACVDISGGLRTTPVYFSDEEGVRPALWISLTAEKGGAAQDLQPVQEDNTVFFGHYEQDGILGNGPEPIAWIVLDSEGDDWLLLSKYILDARAYKQEKEYEYQSWETSDLRSWLNDAFWTAAFSDEEQARVQLTMVDNSPLDMMGRRTAAEGEGYTQDHVFLLSYFELRFNQAVFSYFRSQKALQCAMTNYAIASGGWTNERYTVDGMFTGQWWLRTGGRIMDSAATVFTDGTTGVETGTTLDYIGVRPLIRVQMRGENPGE